MNIGLFGINLSLFFCALSTILLTVSIQSLRDKKSRRESPASRQLLYFLLGGVVFSGLVHLVLHQLFPTDKLPPIWLMLLPFSASIALLVAWYVLRNGRRAHLSCIIATILSAFCFSFLLINSYYRYYPSLYSLLGVQDRLQSFKTADSTTKFVSKDVVSNNTIEHALYNGSSPTNGSVRSLLIPGTKSGFKPQTGLVYEPAIANSKIPIALPVVVLSAGVPGKPIDWVNGGGLIATLDQFAKLHHGITPYVFVVDNHGDNFNNDTECVDSPRGNVETYMAKDVPEYIQKNFSVSSNPDDWAVGGLSLGGLCGILITLRHPDIYHTFLDFGGDIEPNIGSEKETINTLFHGDKNNWQEHRPLDILQKQHFPQLHGFIAVGKSDSRTLVQDAQTLYQSTKNAQIDSVYEAIGGTHSFSVWQKGFQDALPWLSNKLAATDCSTSCL